MVTVSDDLTQKMVVYYVGARGFPKVVGGIGTHCESLIPKLLDAGNIDATALVVNDYFCEPRWEGIDFIAIPTVSRKGVEKVLYSFRCLFYCLQKRPMLVHVQGLNSGLIIPFLRLFGIRVVFTLHSRDWLYPRWGRGGKAVIWFSEQLALRFSNAFICVSQSLAEEMREGRQDVIFLPNGINIPSDKPEDYEDILASIGLESDEYYLFVGRITPEKDCLTLLEGYRCTRATIPLVIVGSEVDDSYAKVVKEASDGLNVRFLGPRYGKELESLYYGSRLVLQTSKHEVSPMVALEALAHGCNLVLSDICPHKEIGAARLRYFAVGNADSLACVIAEAEESPPTESDKKKWKEWLVEERSWGRIANDTLSIYRQVLEYGVIGE